METSHGGQMRTGGAARDNAEELNRFLLPLGVCRQLQDVADAGVQAHAVQDVDRDPDEVRKTALIVTDLVMGACRIVDDPIVVLVVQEEKVLFSLRIRDREIARPSGFGLEWEVDFLDSG